MADEPTSKPAFWTSFPGILTGLGAIIVAVTGLISALFSTGVIGTNANSNSNVAALANAAVVSAATPSPIDPEYARYKDLVGKWEVIETPSLDFENVKKVTKIYEAAVAGNVLTLTGRILAVDDDKNLEEDEESLTSTVVATLAGSGGIGEYRVKWTSGTTTVYEATIRLADDLRQFQGKIDFEGTTFKFVGRKL